MFNQKKLTAMKVEKKSTALFSFKTFRSPDRIAPYEITPFFVQHPDIASSYFNKCPVINASMDNDNEYEQFVSGINSMSSYKEVRALNPEFYDYSCNIMLCAKNDSSRIENNFSQPKPLDDQVYLKIWEELLGQIVTKKSMSARQACLQMILVQHYVKKQNVIDIKDLSKIVIVIPDIVTKCFKPWKYNRCGGNLYGVYNLGIQEYHRVEQTLIGYVPGEVSHIENIMAREYKEKSARNLLKTEQSTELVSERTIENQNDTTTAERNELSSEIARIQENDKSFNISGSVTVSKDSKIFGSFAANTATGYDSSSSSSLSNNEAKNYAKEITERALERIVQNTSEKRTYKIIKEFEENDKHGFDNRLGSQHVTGVYRWIDKVYDNELVNYGKRLALEVDVPHPALLYKRALVWKNNTASSGGASTLEEPKPLSTWGIEGPNDVNATNSIQAANNYGITIQEYSQQVRYLNVNVPETKVDNKSETQNKTLDSIIIPDGFCAVEIEGVGTFSYHTPSGSAYFKITFGDSSYYEGEYNDRGSKNFSYRIDMPNVQGSIPVIISFRRTDSYSLSYKVKYVSDSSAYRDWQNSTYEALQSAYQRLYDEYIATQQMQEAEQNATANDDEEISYSNSANNRLIEERELKRACIEMLSRPYCYEMGKCFFECKEYTCNTCEQEEIKANIPEIVQSETLNEYVKFAQFFENAFQWEILSYEFYPYYYNPKCGWYKLLQTNSDDPIFEAFLQSGLAKVMVPVRPQYAKAVMWYLETGEICTEGNLTAETDDDRYLSLLKELNDSDEVVVIDKWQTRVPSTLTIIQSKSTYLDDSQGLPTDNYDNVEIGSNDAVMVGLENASTTEEE